MSKKRDLDMSDPKVVTRMMLRTLFSTTLRIFAPIMVLFVIGLAIDLNTSTKPWGMAIGTGIGMIIAFVLVAAQLKDIRKNSGKLSLSPAEGDK